MTSAITDIQKWQAVEIGDALETMKQRKKRQGNLSYSLNRGRLSPVDLYCYLKAKFGPPNGILMLTKIKDDSNNLIQWHYSFCVDTDYLEILGMNTRVEFKAISKEKLLKTDWDKLIVQIKDDFKNHGSKISEVRSGLEHWRLFINPYCRLKSIVQKGRKRLIALNINELKAPDILQLGNNKDNFDKQVESYMQIYYEAVFLCATLRMITPVFAESFVNILIFLLASPEVKTDERLYRDFIRKQIDVRVKSLPLYCKGFNRSPNDNDEEFKDFLKLMNLRNDVLHGNIDPEALKFDEVWFDGYTPIFKDEKPFFERALYHSLKHIEPESVLEDIKTVEKFIDYLLSLLYPQLLKGVQLVINDPYPGWREATKRVGSLFPNQLAEIFPVTRETDEQIKPKDDKSHTSIS